MGRIQVRWSMYGRGALLTLGSVYGMLSWERRTGYRSWDRNKDSKEDVWNRLLSFKMVIEFL